MFKTDSAFKVEVIDVGDCEMSEDILIVKAESLKEAVIEEMRCLRMYDIWQ